MAESAATLPADSPIASLRRIVGDEHVIDDVDERTYYSQDIYAEGALAAAIVRPANAEELSRAVAAITAAGHAVCPRGSGNSYTSGYIPTRENTVVVDTLRMDRIVEINLDDMYVTVEAGCPWVELHAALSEHGVRTPYWGPLSGLKSVVGGALSQNSVFFGSSNAGTAADTVLSMDVVLADGSIVSTGSAASVNGTPFFRHYGPDLTGLFTGDTGALGVKAAATLRLIATQPHKRFLSFAFDDYPTTVQAMAAVARSGLATECFGFDPFLQGQRALRESVAKDVKTLGRVMGQAGSVVGALKEGARMALAGRGYLDDVRYSVHVAVEQLTEDSADHAAETVRGLCAEHGREIENTIPKAIHAYPFASLNSMIGPEGERWVPVHGIVPHSRAAETIRRIEALYDDNRAVLDECHIGVGYLLTTVSTTGTLIEPVFFWPDAIGEVQRRHVEPGHLARMKSFPADQAARGHVHRIRQAIMDVFAQVGGCHFQIGKAYPFAETRKPEALALLQALKAAVDPDGLMNPGSLGL